MILQTGMRTDIPAFYAEWLHNRLTEGFVMVRNPYHPDAVTRYRISPDVVDLISFCTKNPAPMFPYFGDLSPYGQYWFVTITGYGTDLEPNVPSKQQVTEDFKTLSDAVGPDAAAWRYDPVVLTDTYTADWHISTFAALAKQLSGYTHTAVFSFLQLYKKVRRNFPEAGAVSPEDRLRLARAFAKIGAEYGMTVKACGERADLVGTGVDCSGCMMPSVYQKVLRGTLHIPHWHPLRDECDCFLGNDIGAYNSCPHLCRYCYANYDAGAVRNNLRLHDPKSPFLIGTAAPGDIVRESDQKSWLDNQLHF